MTPKVLGRYGSADRPEDMKPCLIWIDDKGLHLQIVEPKGSDTPVRDEVKE